jgi:hypothetical protein
LVKERIAAAGKKKEAGNERFKEGKYPQAIELYTEVCKN